MIKGKTYSQRTTEIFREAGFEVQIVERFISYANVRKDFLTCIDLMAMKPGIKTIIGIQCFSSAWTEHQRKICVEYPWGAKFWLSMKHKLLFVGWRRLKSNNKWTPRFGVVTFNRGKLTLTEVDHLWQALK